MERITVKVARVKVLSHYTTGYAKSGLYPTTHHWFYLVEAEGGAIFTVATTKELREGYSFIASVIGENEYRGQKQVKLARVSYTEETLQGIIKGRMDALADSIRVKVAREQGL